MCCAKTSEPVDLPFGLWTRLGQRKHKFNLIHHVALMCPHGRTHCRHLANTVVPSICCGNAALCQITLTTCCCYYQHYLFFIITKKDRLFLGFDADEHCCIRSEQAALQQKLSQIEKKIIVGGENLLEKAEEQEKLLEESAKELEERRQKAESLRKAVEEKEASDIDS